MAVAALNTRDCQPAKDATHEDQPHASILTSHWDALVVSCYLELLETAARVGLVSRRRNAVSVS